MQHVVEVVVPLRCVMPRGAGRILSAVCYGAFFGIASVVAADLVDSAKRSRAISMVFTGLTLANVQQILSRSLRKVRAQLEEAGR